jgi:hypothetical protein
MVATTGHCSAREFLDWAKRQLIITRVYRPWLWRLGFASHVIYCGAVLLSIVLAAGGNPLGLAGFAVAVIPGMGKGASRGYAARLMFPHREEWLDRYGWIYFWMTPIATWIWLYTFVRSVLTRKIEWRGNRYELLGPNQTIRLGAESAPQA